MFQIFWTQNTVLVWIHCNLRNKSISKPRSLTLLKSSMSSSWSELVGDAVADRGCSGDWGRCNMFPPPKPSPSWALNSEWSMVVSWLEPSRPWLMSPSGTSMVTGEELLNCELIGWPRSWGRGREQKDWDDQTVLTPRRPQKQRSGILTIPSDEPNKAFPPDWLMTPRLRCSRPCEGALTKVEANEGSSPSTTAFPGTTTLSEGPVSDNSPKWDTTSDTVRVESGSKEMGGISNSSSPRLGVWNVWGADGDRRGRGQKSKREEDGNKGRMEAKMEEGKRKQDFKTSRWRRKNSLENKVREPQEFWENFTQSHVLNISDAKHWSIYKMLWSQICFSFGGPGSHSMMSKLTAIICWFI